jgi:hypothetical protein
MSSCVAVAASAALGAEITIAGPQGHSTSAGTQVVALAQPTIPYWEYRLQQAQSQASGNRLGVRSFRYGSELRYRPDIVNRDAFRYQNREFRKRRHGDLRGHTHRGLFDGRRARYAPGTRYTKSFSINRQQRYGSTIRYGFQGPRR